ncbi:hypothetical protein NC651_000626 [Populus alba x Populus x berolinensis]|nr:hypothetical protein NC651_000626 [Populus alba x Populus x berolinensis]
MGMIGESYPFFRETWLNLRIKGSQISQFLRRKCKHIPKGLFSCPATVNGTGYSMHWISEAHRNSWHALLDATGMVFGEDRIALAHTALTSCYVHLLGQSFSMNLPSGNK